MWVQCINENIFGKKQTKDAKMDSRIHKSKTNNAIAIDKNDKTTNKHVTQTENH